MSVPPFNELGLLPPGIHPSGHYDFARAFAFNAHRDRMVRDLNSFLEFLAAEVGYAFPYWVGGSFTTSKAAPADIDVIMDLSGGYERSQTLVKVMMVSIRADLIDSHRIDLSCWTHDMGIGRLELFQGIAVPDNPAPYQPMRGIVRVEASTACAGFAALSPRSQTGGIEGPEAKAA